MKFMQKMKKIREYMTCAFNLLGMFVGLVAVPIFWNTLLEKNHFYYVIYSLICLPFLVLYYNSFIRLKTTYNNELYLRFEEELNEESTTKEYLAFLFQQKNFWVQFAVVAILFVLLPLHKTVPVVAWLFGAWGNFGKELFALCIFLPFLFVVYTKGHISAIDYWQQQIGAERDVSKKTKRSTYVSTIVAYAVVPFALLMLWNFIKVYVPLIFQLMEISSSVLLGVLVVLTIVFVILFSFFRVIRARKKCLKEIHRVCRQKNYEIGKIKHAYLSAFCVCKGESFQVKIGEKTYSCKLVGCPQRGVPLVIHPMGGLHFMYSFNLFKTPIFSHTTVKRFGYDSEHSKILIINPVPKKLFCHFGNKIAEIDNGDHVGDYKIYTATAFIRAIENDILDR